AFRPIEEIDGDLVVTVRKDGRLNLQLISDDTFHWRVAAIDHRADRFDDDAAPGDLRRQSSLCGLRGPHVQRLCHAPILATANGRSERSSEAATSPSQINPEPVRRLRQRPAGTAKRVSRQPASPN